jgi:hypothetical protein
MAEEPWRRFRRGYRSSAPTGPEATGFWQLVATLLGARIFLDRAPARCDDSLALLRRLLAGDHPSDESR